MCQSCDRIVIELFPQKDESTKAEVHGELDGEPFRFAAEYATSHGFALCLSQLGQILDAQRLDYGSDLVTEGEQ